MLQKEAQEFVERVVAKFAEIDAIYGEAAKASSDDYDPEIIKQAVQLRLDALSLIADNFNETEEEDHSDGQ